MTNTKNLGDIGIANQFHTIILLSGLMFVSLVLGGPVLHGFYSGDVMLQGQG
jgi:hypothetical protein